MRRSYCIRASADKDLDAIADYLGSRHFEIGIRFLEAVKRECLFLCDYPGAGTLRRGVPKALRGLRSWPIKGFRTYLIMYLRVSVGIDIVRVLHGSRDIRRALRESS